MHIYSVRTRANVPSHFEKIEKGWDLNIQLDDSPLTRLILLTGHVSFNSMYIGPNGCGGLLAFTFRILGLVHTAAGSMHRIYFQQI